MITKIDKNKARKKRHARVRSKITGNENRPRLNVFRSNKNIYAQIIDDTKGRTLVSASNLDKECESAESKTDAAKKVGALIAKRAAEKEITKVTFDRGGYMFHGRVKSLAESARENGLQF